MNSIETISDTSFDNAVSAIRNGLADEGLAMLESVEGEEVMKNLVKAEIAYWRGDWKNAMYYDEHSLSSDHLWYNQFVVVYHLRAYVMAAKKIGAISRAECFLEYYIDLKRKELGNVGVRPYTKIFQNAMRRLQDQEAKDEPTPARFIDGDEQSCQIQMYSMGGPIVPSKESSLPVSLMLEVSWNHVPTRAVLATYEQYADFITFDSHHLMAARNYMLINEPDKVRECIRRVFKIWNPQEKFQVMPMKFFAYSDVMEFIFENNMNNELMLTPRMRTTAETEASDQQQ